MARFNWFTNLAIIAVSAFVIFALQQGCISAMFVERIVTRQ